MKKAIEDNAARTRSLMEKVINTLIPSTVASLVKPLAPDRKLFRLQYVLQKVLSRYDHSWGRKVEENSSPINQFLPLVCHQATALIVGLGGERARWTEDSRRFADTKRRLVGDVALSCAFVGYCGPFNQEFRDHLVKTRCDRISVQSNGVPVALYVAPPL